MQEDTLDRQIKELVKLAAEADHADEFIPLFEPDDSGIDSDDTERVGSSARRNSNRIVEEEETSSDEDPVIRSWWPAKRKNDDLLNDPANYVCPARVWWQVANKKNDERKNMKVQVDPVNKARWVAGRDDSEGCCMDTFDRASPPLYEVELTASDEDDDASVLELVIPMQSRYQRVPTTSPKKTKPRAPRFFCNLFCCIRK